MSSKRSTLTFLIALNVVLATALWYSMGTTRNVFAQTGAQPGAFMCVTARADGLSYDLLYVLDLTARKLYAFYPTSGRSTKLVATPPRDLVKDFNR